jgi:hypothetical protein
MPELRQEYLDILEKREWSVSGYTDDGRVEAGQRRRGHPKRT